MICRDNAYGLVRWRRKKKRFVLRRLCFGLQYLLLVYRIFVARNCPEVSSKIFCGVCHNLDFWCVVLVVWVLCVMLVYFQRCAAEAGRFSTESLPLYNKYSSLCCVTCPHSWMLFQTPNFWVCFLVCNYSNFVSLWFLQCSLPLPSLTQPLAPLPAAFIPPWVICVSATTPAVSPEPESPYIINCLW